MNSFALITAIALAADFSLAAVSIARARMLKTLRKSLTALAAFAIATSFIASSFAGEFTVHQGKRYRATLSLSSVERLVDNGSIAQKFWALGFTSVRVSGSGATRKVEGVWPEGHERQHASPDSRGCHIVTALARAVQHCPELFPAAIGFLPWTRLFLHSARRAQ